ncbi:hypothetical protein L2E82_42907 [Cichorium intybus]|uniref:Uncharacterized protein n=1 Tax=Cichorium intybus TaxID=13427 RepID=A0ACB8ZS71_CICIN|nr:hypothetical protein L2E82_42907 [Cichorium intybus]
MFLSRRLGDGMKASPPSSPPLLSLTFSRAKTSFIFGLPRVCTNGKSIEEMFERFEWDPICSASIAQIHRATLKGATSWCSRFDDDNLQNLQAFALCLQKTDLKFNLNILKSLTLAYGQMILKSGFFHADPHPGNILIFKELPNPLRLGYANLVFAITDNDHMKAADGLRGIECDIFIRNVDDDTKELGINTLSMCENEKSEVFKLAQVMFDTKLPPGVTMLQPYAEDATLKKVVVHAFPMQGFSYDFFEWIGPL